MAELLSQFIVDPGGLGVPLWRGVWPAACMSTMPLWRASSRSQTPKKLLNPNGREPTTELWLWLWIWIVAAPNRYKSALFNSNSFPLILLFQFLSVLPSPPAGPKAALALRGQDTDATNRRIPHHVTSASVRMSVVLFPRFQNCER